MSYIVSGKTFDYRIRLSEMGGKWDDIRRKWVFEYLSENNKKEISTFVGCILTNVEEITPKLTPKEIVDCIVTNNNKKDTVFYGDDRTYFNHFVQKNPVSFFGFSNLSEMIKFIETIPQNKRIGQRGVGYETNNWEWYSTKDMNEAISIAKNGWSEGVNKAKDIIDKIYIEHAIQRRRKYSVAGGQVNVGRMLAGNPDHMISRPKQKGNKVITLFINNSLNQSLTGESQQLKAIAIAAIVDILENNGYNCEIISINISYFLSKHQLTTTIIKHSDEKLNLNDTIFALGHPSFERRFNFACVCQADELNEIWTTQGKAIDIQLEESNNEYYFPIIKKNTNDIYEMINAIKPEGLPLEIKL